MVKISAGASILCITMVLLGVNRGFDISDEGLYVLLADPYQDNVAGIFNYDLFFKLIFKISGFSFSLVDLRIFRLVSYLAGAWALAGFWKNIRNETKIKPEVFWVFTLCLLAGYAFLPPTLSYNSLSVVLVCFWLNLVSEDKLLIKHLIFLGVLLALLVYIKVSLALAFFPLTFLILLFWKKIKYHHSVVLLLPFILFEVVFLLFLEQTALARLTEGIPLNARRYGYQLSPMLKSIAVGGLWVGILGFLFFVLGYLKRIRNRFFQLALPISVIGVLTVSYLTHVTEEWNHLVLNLSSGLIGFYFGLYGLPSWKYRIWAGILLTFPFLLHFGSNVYWLRIGIHYWVFWVLAFFLCFKNFKKTNISQIAFIAVLLVFNGIWWHPFGQDQPLWKEKTSWTVNGKEKLHLDPDLVNVSNKFRDLRQEGVGSVLAAYRIPGIVWLAGHQIPFSPGIWDKSQLITFFDTKPEEMIYNNLDSLPHSWTFSNHRELGIFQGDTLLLLWD